MCPDLQDPRLRPGASVLNTYHRKQSRALILQYGSMIEAVETLVIELLQ
jgi:hypothetical protein